MSRFATLSTADIDNLLLTKDSESSNKSAEQSFNIFLRHLKEKNETIDVKTIESCTLNEILSKFYAEARKEDGNLYKKTSMQSLRYGLQRKIKTIRNDINIMEDKQFKRCNDVFTAQLVHLKRVGLGKVDHKQPISKHDLEL